MMHLVAFVILPKLISNGGLPSLPQIRTCHEMHESMAPCSTMTLQCITGLTFF